ncbi:hypothetical protein [Shimia sediminis]|uniref:hypothetical protein n=1 Tax=Shimia sediminis TaxID=2497945 RepID=UPI000F8D0C8F|nr:hypothetical protein [Shimia sediminis]
MRVIATILMMMAGAVNAADWSEPARGTYDRKAMMDAVRPHAEWLFGDPVQFVVHDLRRAGNIGFGALTAQRPGGKAIDMHRTPGARLGEIDLEMEGQEDFLVLYRKSGDTWVAVHWSYGAGDVWFAWEPLCAEYRPVIEEFCRGL